MEFQMSTKNYLAQVCPMYILWHAKNYLSLSEIHT